MVLQPKQVLTSLYLLKLNFIYLPSDLTASVIMSFFLSSGLTAGVLLSFVMLVIMGVEIIS